MTLGVAEKAGFTPGEFEDYSLTALIAAHEARRHETVLAARLLPYEVIDPHTGKELSFYNGVPYGEWIFGRAEDPAPYHEDSTAMFIKMDPDGIYRPDPSMPTFEGLQDPNITTVVDEFGDTKVVITGVHLVKDEHQNIVTWVQVYYVGDTVHDMQLMGRGAIGMKDNELRNTPYTIAGRPVLEWLTRHQAPHQPLGGKGRLGVAYAAADILTNPRAGLQPGQTVYAGRRPDTGESTQLLYKPVLHALSIDAPVYEPELSQDPQEVSTDPAEQEAYRNAQARELAALAIYRSYYENEALIPLIMRRSMLVPDFPSEPQAWIGGNGLFTVIDTPPETAEAIAQEIDGLDIDSLTIVGEQPVVDQTGKVYTGVVGHGAIEFIHDDFGKQRRYVAMMWLQYFDPDTNSIRVCQPNVVLTAEDLPQFNGKRDDLRFCVFVKHAEFLPDGTIRLTGGAGDTCIFEAIVQNPFTGCEIIPSHPSQALQAA